MSCKEIDCKKTWSDLGIKSFEQCSAAEATSAVIGYLAASEVSRAQRAGHLGRDRQDGVQEIRDMPGNADAWEMDIAGS